MAASTHVVTVTTTQQFPTSDSVDMVGAPFSTIRKVGEFLQAFSAGGLYGATTVDVQVGTSQAAAASETLTFASVAAGNAILVNGVPFVAVSGTPVRANGEFKRGVSNTADAADFATTLNASINAAISGVVTASAASGVVTLTPAAKGALGNALTVETFGIVAQGTITYSGSSGTQTATINGVNVTAASGANDTATATAVAAAINASANALVAGHVRATSSAGVVTIYALYPGTRGNSVTLAASGTGASASGSALSGATVPQWQGVQASGTVTITSGSGTITATINGVASSVTWATSDANTATLLANAINQQTNLLVADLILATASSNVVTITAANGGISGNAITLAASGTGASASGARLTGGAVPTQVALGGTGVTQANSFPGARLAGGVGLAGSSVSTANALTI